MKKKAYIILTTVLLLISPILYRPFKISANQTLSAPFLGVNVYMIDRETVVKIDEIDLSRLQLYCSNYDSGTGGCKAYRDDNAVQSYLSVESTIANTTIYKFEFILDGYYVGTVNFRYLLPTGTYTNVTSYVNGNNFEFSILQGSEPTIQIVSYDLNRNVNSQWQYPIESFNVCSYMLNSLPQRYTGINSYNDYMFPIFKIKQNDIVYKTNVANNSNWNHTFIFYINDSCNNVNTFSNFFSIDRGEVLSYKQLNRYFFDGRIGYLCQVTIGNFSTSGVLNIKYINANDRYYMPVYCNAHVYNENVSTDFALIFGLNNRLLNALDNITGNQQSQQSVNNATTTNQSASDTFTQEETLVNNAEQDLQDNLDNLDIQNKNNNLFGNSKFVASAQWVKLQFDNLTNNNAFGYMITFSLVIGIALVIVGKLRG